jgi:anti-anti-sigma regulatory factor
MPLTRVGVFGGPEPRSGAKVRADALSERYNHSMRSFGEVETARDLGPTDHVCWTFDGYGAFRAAAVDFLSEGLALGLRVGLVAARHEDVLRADLGGLGDVDALVATGALSTVPLHGTYDEFVSDPTRQVDAYAEATEQALADGYAGLRVAADVTSLITGPREVDAFARYECLIDQYMRTHPFSALCGYDTALVGASAAAAIACVHPLRRRGGARYGLFAGPHDLMLTGNVDASLDATFEPSVERLLAPLEAGPVRIDCAALDFVDHRGLAALDRAAAARQISVELVRPPWSTRRLVDILGFRALDVVEPR